MEEGIERQMANILETITKMKEELDRLRPLPPTVLAQVEQKLRLEANFNSNAIEGNTLTLGETRSLILHGLTAHGKPLRDHLDIEGHDNAVKAIEAAVRDDLELNGVFIRNLHRVLLKEPYETEAMTPDGKRVRRRISLGDYKSTPNNVVTSTGEIYYFTPPEQVKPAMSDLLAWYRTKEREGEHPIIIAATFQYRFVRIHPFDDGNGRMARLLMNMILIKHGYTVAMIRKEDRNEYLDRLEQADKTEDLTEFINYIATCCEYALNLHLKAARGEPIYDIDDIDKEIALFKGSLMSASAKTLPTREYIESVMYPFYDYCLDKAQQFLDVFGEIRTLLSVSGFSTEGRAIQICSSSNTLQPLLDYSAKSDLLRSISAELSIEYSRFQGRQDESAVMRIACNNHASGSWWTFSMVTPSVYWDLDERDLDSLKREFNHLLRELMMGLNR